MVFAFFGAMSRDENIEAVKWFLDNIWISLKKKNQKLMAAIVIIVVAAMLITTVLAAFM